MIHFKQQMRNNRYTYGDKEKDGNHDALHMALRQHLQQLGTCFRTLKKFEALTQQINKAKKEQETDSTETLKTFHAHHAELMADTRVRLQHVPAHCYRDHSLDPAFVEAVWLSLNTIRL